jgi:hypothetical protein
MNNSQTKCDSEHLQLDTREVLLITLLLIALSSDLVIALGVTLYSVDRSIIIPVCLAESSILSVKWISCYS